MTKPKSAAQKAADKSAREALAKNEPAPPMTAKQKRDAKLQGAAEATAKGKPTAEDTVDRNESAIVHPEKVPDAHGKIAEKSRGATVVVACKLGVAYYDIQLSKMEEVQENTQTGPRTIKQARRIGEVVRLRGTAYPRGTVPDGFPEKPTIVDGAALNFGIDEEWWDAWVEQNKLNPLVVNKMIFAHVNLDFVKGIAKETKDQKSGLEPINPKNDTRMPKSTRSDVGNIETEEGRRARERASSE